MNEGANAAKASEAGRDDETSARRWADSGLAWLTGSEGGAPVIASAPLPLAADRALASLAALAPAEAFAALGGAELLAERAACLGLGRRGRVAPGGACRLLEARGGWLAANLPRAEDARALAAWLEDDALAAFASELDEEAWRALAQRVASRERDACVARAREIGLAVAPADLPAASPEPWQRIARKGPRGAPPPREAPPLVLELASLWAGPLAGRLLRLAGARVIKLESTRRPDGGRAGNAQFFDLLNEGKQSVALDFASAGDLRRLAALVERADIVIEGSRPRALVQLGIDAARWVSARPGRVWLSLTGHGREAPFADWVAFGDDAAAAAGLCWCVPSGAPLFVGDAIADPLAGLHGALAALAHWQRGEGALLDVSLRGVCAAAIGSAHPRRRADREAQRSIARPRLLAAAASAAHPLGADTAGVLAELGIA